MAVGQMPRLFSVNKMGSNALCPKQSRSRNLACVEDHLKVLRRCPAICKGSGHKRRSNREHKGPRDETRMGHQQTNRVALHSPASREGGTMGGETSPPSKLSGTTHAFPMPPQDSSLTGIGPGPLRKGFSETAKWRHRFRRRPLLEKMPPTSCYPRRAQSWLLSLAAGCFWPHEPDFAALKG